MIDYDTSQPALQSFATGNPHYDVGKFAAADAQYLCYLALDNDSESAEAALDRLRSLLAAGQISGELTQVYQTATLIRLGSEDVTVRSAARDLVAAIDKEGIARAFPERVALTQTTGLQKLDVLLESVVADLSAVFGDRMLACYALGSAFDGSGVQTSDIDLHLLFKGAHSSCLKQAVHGFTRELCDRHQVDLDLVPFFESDIKPWADVRTALGGIQIFGSSSSVRLVLPPMDEYVRENMHKAYYYLSRARGFPDRLYYPVPAAGTDRFSGYLSRTHEDGSPSTKELVVVAGWLSTALVSRQARRYIASKSASYAGYREHIANEWTSHLENVFELVRKTWSYRLPADEQDRAHLAAICARQVDFENHFLREYEKFLREETASADLHHAELAGKLLNELFPGAGATDAKPGLLLRPWQVLTKRRDPDPRLISVDHFLVKVPSLRSLDDKALREAFQRFDEFGVVIIACKDTLNLRYDLLALQRWFGEVVFHPRSDSTGISSVRNLFTPEQGFAGTTREMQTAHTDGSFLADPPGIVALQAEICGLCGGESTLVFGDSLYKYMECEHPQELEELFRADAYTIGRSGESCRRPVFWREGGRIHVAFRCGNGEQLKVSPRARPGFYRVYDFVNAASNQLRFRLPANHVLVVDNHRNLHGRLRWPPDTVRCLNRLWLDGRGTDQLYPGLGIRR